MLLFVSCCIHRQLLLDCGIGDAVGGGEGEGADCLSALSQHRALIFCQYKSMLDIIEQDLLKCVHVHLQVHTFTFSIT